jgi:hypothetical protein
MAMLIACTVACGICLMEEKEKREGHIYLLEPSTVVEIIKISFRVSLRSIGFNHIESGVFPNTG